MSSAAKQSRTKNFLLLLCTTLVALNYATGVFVYRYYVKKLSMTSLTCQLVLKDGFLHGEIKIEPPEGFAVYPVDYQVYFHDKRGDTLQLVADSLNGKNYAVFNVPAKEKLLSTEWHVAGYSNVKINWLWLSMNLALPIEVELK
ncbi:MAG: hypothetical protein WHT65_10930 [Pseudothermotoga sp.]